MSEANGLNQDINIAIRGDDEFYTLVSAPLINNFQYVYPYAVIASLDIFTHPRFYTPEFDALARTVDIIISPWGPTERSYGPQRVGGSFGRPKAIGFIIISNSPQPRIEADQRVLRHLNYSSLRHLPSLVLQFADSLKELGKLDKPRI